MKGYEGTPWVSIEVERAGYRDRPYGWIVTTRTPGHLRCTPLMHAAELEHHVREELEQALRTPLPIALTKAEPLPPARRC